MNKKQVNALLKVMGKDKFRPVLCSALVDTYNDRAVLVATDGYILSAVYLGETDESYTGKRVSREAIERWYKLANGKSVLNGETLQELMEDDVVNARDLSGVYPEWKTLIPTSHEASDVMAFNADYVKTIQDLNGDTGTTIRLNGKLGAMVVDTDVSLSLIMPMKA